MDFSKVYSGEGNSERLLYLIEVIRAKGPIDMSIMEELAHIKNATPNIFAKHEQALLSAMGLFYKPIEDKSLYGLIFDTISASIKDIEHATYTPIQVDMLHKVRKNESFSFSAPTSAGKSHVIRALIEECDKDVVIVVPSRALLTEYIMNIRQHLKDIVLPLQFIERINLEKSSRRVYVVTPERAFDVFRNLEEHNVSMFLFDEAQLSEEKRRGVLFDALVENICRCYPNVKKVFAHPFIANPEAQIVKHNNTGIKGLGYAYNQQSVGKIFVVHDIDGDKDKWAFFSPYDKKSEEYECKNDIILKFLEQKKSVLIFTSKEQLKGYRIRKYIRYLRVCKRIENEEALAIISQISEYIGADLNNPWKKSILILLMSRGIVYHHGSMPLKVRSLVEQFVRLGHARVCLATPTLLQGINMPFDLVWIENYLFRDKEENMRALSLKNLLGRAGRSTTLGYFDVGWVVIERKNIKSFKDRIKREPRIKEAPLIERAQNETDVELKEFVEAIIEGSYDETYNMTLNQVSRLQSRQLDSTIKQLLDDLLPGGKLISISSFYSKQNKNLRNRVKEAFQHIFEQSLTRKLVKGEKSIISEALHIFIKHVNGLNLKSIAHSRLRDIQERVALQSNSVPFVIKAKEIPDSSLKANPPLYGKDELYNYDSLVYDTYDYIDKVLSMSISSVINVSMAEYYERTGDGRADSLAKFIKYGSNDDKVIALTRYGFTLEDMDWLLNCVCSVNENKITFNENISSLNNEQKLRIACYL